MNLNKDYKTQINETQTRQELLLEIESDDFYEYAFDEIPYHSQLLDSSEEDQIQSLLWFKETFHKRSYILPPETLIKIFTLAKSQNNKVSKEAFYVIIWSVSFPSNMHESLFEHDLLSFIYQTFPQKECISLCYNLVAFSEESRDILIKNGYLQMLRMLVDPNSTNIFASQLRSLTNLPFKEIDQILAAEIFGLYQILFQRLKENLQQSFNHQQHQNSNNECESCSDCENDQNVLQYNKKNSCDCNHCSCNHDNSNNNFHRNENNDCENKKITGNKNEFESELESESDDIYKSLSDENCGNESEKRNFSDSCDEYFDDNDQRGHINDSKDDYNLNLISIASAFFKLIKSNEQFLYAFMSMRMVEPFLDTHTKNEDYLIIVCRMLTFICNQEEEFAQFLIDHNAIEFVTYIIVEEEMKRASLDAIVLITDLMFYKPEIIEKVYNRQIPHCVLDMFYDDESCGQCLIEAANFSVVMMALGSQMIFSKLKEIGSYTLIAENVKIIDQMYHKWIIRVLYRGFVTGRDDLNNDLRDFLIENNELIDWIKELKENDSVDLSQSATSLLDKIISKT
ncbi:hypothetical protein TRFO_18262 [Tritrichomonas foetus]|uniref:Uncharacterized protein n=1 Tax=Tritrichomonas foetus TaxID=1144522 RepID=A0A1J4KL89_9EUKA|nr:hypothetical protein TRFO_18262 [Tritrichomonas foetus]|eukprot:OHT12065.1 hypothetical protein TRFO_18262 [Tritrichomonas foetus]